MQGSRTNVRLAMALKMRPCPPQEKVPLPEGGSHRNELQFASQAAWYRMENGPKSKNGRKLAKK